MKRNFRRLAGAAIALYSLLIFYFMFLAFNRSSHAGDTSGYTFMLVPEKVPLRFPEPTFFWLFDFGNIAAFIPFGIVIPLLFRLSYARFIALFLVAIAALETIQALTYLGSFDVDDIISNTIGASIGYAVYRVSRSAGPRMRRLAASGLCAIALLAGVVLVSEGFDAFFKKSEGPFQPLNAPLELNAPSAGTLPALTVDGKPIKPQINAYASDKGSTFTFKLGHLKNVNFYANYAIPDQTAHNGHLSIYADGEQVLDYSDEYEARTESILIPFGKIDELRIVIEGDAVLWDVGYRRMKHWWE
ncbi:VanZ family protein [Cohnella sp. 56]|uniref:VanZ family protein n=1 Tax=Cohnella sp. 56 TaxID=3113722 RepID=UPI0030EA611E